MQRVLDSMVGAPAFVLNGRLDILAAHDLRIHTTGVKLIHHPVVGVLDLPFESFPLAGDPSQSLLSYTAEPGSASQDALNLLASWAVATDDIEQPASTDASKEAETFRTPD